MALANTDKLDQAVKEREAVGSIAGEDAVKNLGFLEGSASQLLQIAGHVLTAEIAGKQGDTDRAVESLGRAQAEEYALAYTEPPGWPLPVRQYQGAAFLAAGRPADAETAYRADLVDYPENGWSLYGLGASLRAQKKSADDVDRRFTEAWTGADVKLASSRF
jgi:hypothetical protein